MSLSSSISIWAVLAITVAFTILAAGVVAAVLIHSKKIRESESRFRLLFDSVFDSIVLLDELYMIVDANKSFCSLLGFEKKEIIRQPLDGLVAREKWLPLQEEFSKSLASGIGYRGETDLVNKKGKVVHVELGGKGLAINGRCYVLASIRDIGARLEAERELKKKNAALSELLTHLEDGKLKYRQQIATAINDVIMPTMDKLMNADGSVSKPHYDALKTNLGELAAEAGGMVYAFGKMTPREVEICNMVRTGKTSKDIAEALRISILTVNKHRERIRRKLVITKKEINLTTFLKNS